MPGPVLVGVSLDDRDGAAIALGAVLARLSARPLALAHAYPYEPLTVPLPEYETALRDETLQRLDRLADGLRPELEVTVHAHARISAAYGMHELAERLGAAVIVVGSSHHGPVGQVLLGTIATRLFHGAPCPVAVAPAGYAGLAAGAHRIGVAVDGGDEATPPSGAGSAGVASYTVALHVRAERALTEARDRIPVALRGTCELLTGRPEDELPVVSEALDLLVCGSRGYGPLRAVLLGGVSSALARRSRCPLLVVPRGRGGALADAGDAVGAVSTPAAP